MRSLDVTLYTLPKYKNTWHKRIRWKIEHIIYYINYIKPNDKLTTDCYDLEHSHILFLLNLRRAKCITFFGSESYSMINTT